MRSRDVYYHQVKVFVSLLSYAGVLLDGLCYDLGITPFLNSLGPYMCKYCTVLEWEKGQGNLWPTGCIIGSSFDGKVGNIWGISAIRGTRCIRGRACRQTTGLGKWECLRMEVNYLTRFI